jgi:propanol-preferring alcohol dehydrogenase
VAQWKSIV